MRVRNLRAVTPSQCVTGHEYLFVNDVTATITSADTAPDGDTQLYWVYTATIAYPDGTTVSDAQIRVPLITETGTEFDFVYKRSPKPAMGTTFSRPDGSMWIYPDDGSGTYECFLTGTNATQGDTRTYAEIGGTTGIPPIADPTYDWQPIQDGTLLGPGDVVLYTTGRAYMISGKTSLYDPPTKTTMWTFYQAGTPDPTIVATMIQPTALPRVIGFQKDVYQVSPPPAAGSKWRATDGSQWIYPGDIDAFYCWRSGTVYKKGAVFQLGDLTVTLSPAS